MARAWSRTFPARVALRRELSNVTHSTDSDGILRVVEAAARVAADGHLDLARDHLAGLDLDYARELRRAKLASVAGAVLDVLRGTGLMQVSPRLPCRRATVDQ